MTLRADELRKAMAGSEAARQAVAHCGTGRSTLLKTNKQNEVAPALAKRHRMPFDARRKNLSRMECPSNEIQAPKPEIRD